MSADLYAPSFLPADAYRKGLGGIAAGDVDNDGANDLIMAGLDGTLTLARNRCLDGRGDKAHPTHHQRVLSQTGIISVTVARIHGALGAQVRVIDDDDNVVALRKIGGDVLTGCRGPDAVNIALRGSGSYIVRVRRTDGAETERTVAVSHSSVCRLVF